MEESVVSAGFVAMLVPGEPTKPQAERMVRAALRAKGEQPWRDMSIDLYPGGGGSLVIARPAPPVAAVYIDERAMEWLSEKFDREDRMFS